MITALQDVSNVSVVNVAPASGRVALTGEARSLPTTPSAIVFLNTALRSPLTYDASGRLESQVALGTNALAATQLSDAFATSDVAQSLVVGLAPVELAGTATTANVITNPASPPTIALSRDVAVTSLAFIPDAPVANPDIAFDAPVTPDILAALSNTFNPLTPGSPDVTPLITSGPVLPSALAGVIADTIATLADAPNTPLPLPVAAALPAAGEADAATLLAAAANALAPTVSNAAFDSDGATAAPLTPTALPDTRTVTPEPDATSAVARAEAVLTTLNALSAGTVSATPTAAGAPTAASTDAVASAAPVTADPIAAPAVATTVAPSVAGATISAAPDEATMPAQAPTIARDAALTADDIVTNPFYPAMAASLYLSAMTFRLQQASATELNSPADNVQMVGDVRAVSGAQLDRQGPADDFRNVMRTFA